MRKIYFFLIALFVSLTVSAQTETIIDLTEIDEDYTDSVDGDLVIDVATLVSKLADPALSYDNPFYGLDFTEAEISFDVNNYDTVHVLGCLLAFYDEYTPGRMYFTNGSYLGYNVEGTGWFDADLLTYGIDSNFLGEDAWKHVQLKFSASNYALYVDSVLAFDKYSTHVTISYGNGMDTSKCDSVLVLLKNAPIVVFGTGSWWSDNQRPEPDNSYYDIQYSYLKNIKFTSNTPSSINQVIVAADGELVREEFFSITGAKVVSDFNALVPGIYIKRQVYSNGAIKTIKFIKSDDLR